MQIIIDVKDGATPEGIARALRFQANLFDGIDAKKAASNAMTGSPLNGAGKKKSKPADEDEEIEETEDEEIEDESEEDEAEEESEDEESDDADDSDDEESDDADDSDDEETEDEDEAPAKKAKGKQAKLTAKEEKMLKEVNAALKARAKKTSFDKVKVWLKKKFKVESINHLKPSQFAAVIKAAKAA